MNRLNILVLFGGQSSEHEVSLVSATNVLGLLNPDKYHVVKVGITKDGKWLRYEGAVERIKDGSWEKGEVSPVYLTPDATAGLLQVKDGKLEHIDVDVVFPVLHGKFGEDGTIQGLCTLAKIPFVGAGVMASAVSMDKIMAKMIFRELEIPQADWMVIYKEELAEMDTVLSKIEAKFSYPVFVKPANAGSSVGIGKSHNRNDLEKHLIEAARHDRKILIEEFIFGREVECAVLGNIKPFPSILGEIIPDKEFYDYEAKYESNSKLIIPAILSQQKIDEIHEYAKRAFLGLDLRGMARIDFFVHKQTDCVYLNEVNTIPGFTDISMYPMLLGKSGYEGEALVDRLIELAIEEFSGIYES